MSATSSQVRGDVEQQRWSSRQLLSIAGVPCPPPLLMPASASAGGIGDQRRIRPVVCLCGSCHVLAQGTPCLSAALWSLGNRPPTTLNTSVELVLPSCYCNSAVGKLIPPFLMDSLGLLMRQALDSPSNNALSSPNEPLSAVFPSLRHAADATLPWMKSILPAALGGYDLICDTSAAMIAPMQDNVVTQVQAMAKRAAVRHAAAEGAPNPPGVHGTAEREVIEDVGGKRGAGAPEHPDSSVAVHPYWFGKLDVWISLLWSVVLHVAKLPMLEHHTGPAALVLCATPQQCEEVHWLLHPVAEKLKLVVHSTFDPFPLMPEERRADVVISTPRHIFYSCSVSVPETNAAPWHTVSALSGVRRHLDLPTIPIGGPVAGHLKAYQLRHIAQLAVLDVDGIAQSGFLPLLEALMSSGTVRRHANSHHHHHHQTRPNDRSNDTSNGLPPSCQVYLVSNTQFGRLHADRLIRLRRQSSLPPEKSTSTPAPPLMFLNHMAVIGFSDLAMNHAAGFTASTSLALADEHRAEDGSPPLQRRRLDAQCLPLGDASTTERTSSHGGSGGAETTPLPLCNTKYTLLLRFAVSTQQALVTPDVVEEVVAAFAHQEETLGVPLKVDLCELRDVLTTSPGANNNTKLDGAASTDNAEKESCCASELVFRVTAGVQQGSSPSNTSGAEVDERILQSVRRVLHGQLFDGNILIAVLLPPGALRFVVDDAPAGVATRAADALHSLSRVLPMCGSRIAVVCIDPGWAKYQEEQRFLQHSRLVVGVKRPANDAASGSSIPHHRSSTKGGAGVSFPDRWFPGPSREPRGNEFVRPVFALNSSESCGDCCVIAVRFASMSREEVLKISVASPVVALRPSLATAASTDASHPCAVIERLLMLVDPVALLRGYFVHEDTNTGIATVFLEFWSILGAVAGWKALEPLTAPGGNAQQHPPVVPQQHLDQPVVERLEWFPVPLFLDGAAVEHQIIDGLPHPFDA